MQLVEQGKGPARNCRVSAQTDRLSGALLSSLHLGPLMQQPEKKGRRKRRGVPYPTLASFTTGRNTSLGMETGTGDRGRVSRGRPGEAGCATQAPTPTSTCKWEPRVSQAHPAAATATALPAERPRKETALHRDAAPAPGSPLPLSVLLAWLAQPPPGALLSGPRRTPVDGGPAAILGRAAPEPPRVHMGQGSWAQTVHPCWRWALRTTQAGVQDARAEVGPDPLEAQPNL